MHLQEIIQVKGCITQEIYIKGKSLSELEHILGFQKDRLKNGIIIAALTQLPGVSQFELLGYSQVAGHKFNGAMTHNLDVSKLKEMVRREVFTLMGMKRLVKVIANTPHNAKVDNDTQYPPGLGVPQWKLTSSLPARVISIVNPGGVYS